MSDEKGVSLIKRYLNEDNLKTLSIKNYNVIEIVSNDTINEELLANKILKSEYKEELLAATLQLSIAGFARNNYNQYKYKGVLKEMKDLFRKADVHYDNSIQSKIDEGVLTPRRLQRIFRYQVKEFLEINKHITSFLFNKHGENKMEFRSICFPNAEHLVTSKLEAQYLYDVYKRLDHNLEERNLQHGFCLRAKRVFLARGIDVED